MKILYVTTVSGTINAFLVPHINMLLDNGHQVDVACKIGKPINPQLINRGCQVFDINFQRSPLKFANYMAYKKIKKIVVDGNYDLVHTHTPIASFLTKLACRNSGVKVLYTAHGFHFFAGAPLKNWLMFYPLERVSAKYTDGIITLNQEDYISAMKFKLRMENSVFKTNGVGVDLTKFSPVNFNRKVDLRKEYGYKVDDFILFYAAELNKNKHQDLLINAINLLKPVIPNIRLLLAGIGDLREKYEEQVKVLGIQGNIEFLGYRTDIDKLLKMSDIAVASSRREGLPVNIMEAMATGLPLVVSDSRGQRDLVIDGENGSVVGLDDYEGFANAIKQLYNSEELRERFGKNNIERIKRHSINNVIKEIREIYSKYL